MPNTPKAFFAAATYWDSAIHVGSQHIATHALRSGYDVAYCSNPISPLHVLGGVTDTLRKRYHCWLKGGELFEEGRLWAYVPASLCTPHNSPVLRSRWVARNWHRLAMPSPWALAARQGFLDVDFMYCDTPVQHFWLRQVKYRRLAYRMADYSDLFDNHVPALTALEQEMLDKADVVAYPSTHMAEHVRSRAGEKAYYLPNGVDFNHFAAPAPCPADLAAIPGPRILFVGALAEWVDYAWINAAVAALPAFSFVLIGPLSRKAEAELKPAQNLHLLGGRPFRLLPGYLQHCNAGIIPFNVQGYPKVHSVRPLKLFEYMAAGLPAVVSRWSEVQQLKAPVMLADSAEDFIELIQAAIQGTTAQAGVAFAKAASWDTILPPLFRKLAS